jgi:hypothetical protein
MGSDFLGKASLRADAIAFDVPIPYNSVTWREKLWTQLWIALGNSSRN